MFVVLASACGPRPDSAPSITVVTDSASRVRYDSAGSTWLRLTSVRWMRGSDERWRDHRTYLLREEKVERCCTESEHPSESEFRILAWRDTVPDPPVAWTLTLRADDADLWNGFYRAVYEGCCDSADLYEYYDLRSGGPPYRASQYFEPADSVLPSLSVPNSPLARFVAFHDMYSPQDPPEVKQYPQLVGVLQYGDQAGPTRRVLLISTDSATRNARVHKTALVFDDTTSSEHGRALWAADMAVSRSALSGFSIEVELFTFDELVPIITVRIPVARDELQLGRASVPTGLRLQMAR